MNFDKVSGTIQWEKVVYSINHTGQLAIHIEKNEGKSLPHTIYKK